MNYAFEATSTDYTIPLTKEFNVVCLQNVYQACEDVFGHDLDSELTNIDGVSEVEYNPMFGNNLHISIETEHDNDVTKKRVTDFLERTSALYTQGNDSTSYNFAVKMTTLGNFEDDRTLVEVAQVFCENSNIELVDMDGEKLTIMSNNGCSYSDVTLRETKDENGKAVYTVYYVDMKHEFVITDAMTPF